MDLMTEWPAKPAVGSVEWKRRTPPSSMHSVSPPHEMSRPGPSTRRVMSSVTRVCVGSANVTERRLAESSKESRTAVGWAEVRTSELPLLESSAGQSRAESGTLAVWPAVQKTTAKRPDPTTALMSGPRLSGVKVGSSASAWTRV
jgi:hypothetical protein